MAVGSRGCSRARVAWTEMLEKCCPRASHWSWGDHRWAAEEDRRETAWWLRVLAALRLLTAFQTVEGRVERSSLETSVFHLSVRDRRRAVVRRCVAWRRLALAARKPGFPESWAVESPLCLLPSGRMKERTWRSACLLTFWSWRVLWVRWSRLVACGFGGEVRTPACSAALLMASVTASTASVMGRPMMSSAWESSSRQCWGLILCRMQSVLERRSFGECVGVGGGGIAWGMCMLKVMVK